MPNARKSDDPKLDMEAASQMLENIFAACEVEPNTVPLSVLSSYSSYRRERFLLQKVVLIIVIAIFCMIPLLFVSPKFTIHDTTSQTGTASYKVNISSVIPIDQVIAVMDGRAVTVSETAKKTYLVEPARNGSMTITVKLKNRQSRTETVEVTSVDTEPPVMVSDKTDGQYLYLYVKDSASGIDYKKVTAQTASGKEATPSSYNETEGCIIFRYPQENLTVHVPDKSGNALDIVLSLKKN